MEPTSRRSILGALGLGAVGLSTEALAHEDDQLYPMHCPAMTKRGPEYQDKMATALENLARSIRNRDALLMRLAVNSETEGDDFLSHTVTLTLELPAMQSVVRAPEQVRRAEEMFQEARDRVDKARTEAEEIVEQAMIQRAKAAKLLREAEENHAKWAFAPPVPPTGD